MRRVLAATAMLFALTGCSSDMGATSPSNFFVQDVGGAHCIVFIGDNYRAAMQCDFGHGGAK